MFEKTLDDILRVPGRIATTTEECVEPWPVSFAKSGERFRRSFFEIGPPCLQDDRPMRRLERRTASCNVPGIGFVRKFNILERMALRDKTKCRFRQRVCFLPRHHVQ